MYILYKAGNRASCRFLKYIQNLLWSKIEKLEKMDKCRQYSKRESAGITFFILKRVFGDVMRVKKLDACISSDNTQSVCVQHWIDRFLQMLYAFSFAVCPSFLIFQSLITINFECIWGIYKMLYYPLCIRYTFTEFTRWSSSCLDDSLYIISFATIDIFSCSVYSSPKTIILLLDLYEILPPSKYLLYCVITFCNSFENHSRFACLFTCNGHWDSFHTLRLHGIIWVNLIQIFHFTCHQVTIFAYLYSTFIKCNIDVFSLF